MFLFQILRLVRGVTLHAKYCLKFVKRKVITEKNFFSDVVSYDPYKVFLYGEIL